MYNLHNLITENTKEFVQNFENEETKLGIANLYSNKNDIYEYLARDYIDVYSIYWKSQFLYLKKELDSAQIYLEEGLQSGSVYTKASCFDLLSKIKREEGKHALAYAYRLKFEGMKHQGRTLCRRTFWICPSC